MEAALYGVNEVRGTSSYAKRKPMAVMIRELVLGAAVWKVLGKGVMALGQGASSTHYS